MNNSFITGKFRSSFSTTIIGKFENPVIDLRNIELRGRKILYNADFVLSEPTIIENNLKLKETYISNVEVLPKEGLLAPLDKAKKLNLFQVQIINPIVIHQQDIDGVRHGEIEGLLFAKLVDTKNEIPITKQQEVKNIENYTDKTIIDDSNSYKQNTGCLPGSSLIRKIGYVPGSGCLGVFRNGCLGVFLLLFFIALISLFFKNCSDNNVKKHNSDNIKTEENNTDDYINDNENRISEKDKTTYVDEKTIKEYRTILLPNVQFYKNSSVLIQSSKNDLDNLALYLLENLDAKAKIIGHTDNVGDETFNISLSQKRANSVKEYLVEKAVNANRIIAIGKGSSEPKTSNDTEEGRIMNRRVEVQLESSKSTETN